MTKAAEYLRSVLHGELADEIDALAARLAEAERMQKIAQDQSESIGNQYAVLQARLAEAERLLDDAKHAPGPAAVMTAEEWWTAYQAWYGLTADSAEVGPQHKCAYCAMGLELVSNPMGKVWHEFDDETRVECTAVTVNDSHPPDA